jgi:serine/threonine protein kinase
MEYTDEKSLENYLSSKKSLLFEDKILRIGSQIAAGLDFIHQKSFFVEI